MAVTLVVSMVGREAQSITFDLPRVVIGRGAHADLRLPARSVSDLHAVLRKDGNELSLVDDGSTNGTRVNGASLPHGRRKLLHDGDVIAIAPFTITVRVVVGQADPPERTASLARRLLHDALSSSGGEAAPPRLVLLTGKQAGQAWVLPPPPSRLLIGREAACDVVLADERDCSRQHAEIVRETEGSTARDLSSKNGFSVGGRPMSERRLRHGDELTIGRTTLRYHDPTEELLRALEGGVDEPPPPPPPVVAIASPAPAAASPVPAAASPAPAALSAPAVVVSASSETTPVVSTPQPQSLPATLARRASRGVFDWVVVVLAVVVLVVSASALVLLLHGGR